ncbi:DUF992 domain-containing protein [Pikeienuella piscinae]|uniref:DUF992 domain-containing protein n=1 Tax=Pikeienuella piscinae TaxID=2748098 RepID=A0A7L5BTT5_9RHOB|nr:DUF992 domain-containing protein [Pikeienuella piscinae]QIE54912.1 DUF992 domain-containing protein [Pikeienuella piscinae]
MPMKFASAFAISAAALAGAALAPVVVSAEENDVEIGTLTCRQIDRTNLVVFSEATFDCTFDPTSGENEKYKGKTTKVGVDLTAYKVETLLWYVFAPSADHAPGALQGDYGGASVDATVGVGGGVRVLVGGFERSFTLQPASVSGQTGVGIAAGIEAFELTYMPDQ